MIEKLNSADKDRLKLEIKQVLVSYVAIGIVVTILVAASIIFIQKSERLPIGKNTVVSTLLLAVAFGFAAFLFYSLKDYLKDLKSDSKTLLSGQITDKLTNTNWGWHGSPAADSTSQPKLVEYFIIFNNQKIPVEETEYNKLTVGDWVSMHFTVRSKILLSIQKELR